MRLNLPTHNRLPRLPVGALLCSIPVRSGALVFARVFDARGIAHDTAFLRDALDEADADGSVP